MITAPEIIAIMAPALLALAATLIWALHEIGFLLEKNHTHEAAEYKRQAQRIAASAAAARARAAKGKS